MALAGPEHGSARQEFPEMARAAAAAGEALLADAIAQLRPVAAPSGKISAETLDREQRATHGLAWLATYVEAIRQTVAHVAELVAADRFGEIEQLSARIALGEYLAQIVGGIPMSQSEIVRPADLGLSSRAVAARLTPAVDMLIA